MTTVSEYLRAARSDDERRDCELLLAHVLGRERSYLYAHPDASVCGQRIAPLLARRADGVPIAYLTGKREFWSLELAVTPAVLVPRPETELVVELTLARLAEDGSVLDLGTGSGAIALAIAKEKPHCRVAACDVSPAALEVARGNARRLGIDVHFVESDWFGAIDQTFDVIVANPPYVAATDSHLTALRHEPQCALVAGADGLDALRRVIAGAPAHLDASGWLIVEHGNSQGGDVRDLFHAAEFRDIATYPDLAGHDRATVGRR
jgi:release factor glutamine methyltransferase